MQKCAPILFLVISIFGGPICALADVVFLSNGGKVDCELLNPDESPRETYLLKLPAGGRLKLNQDQVARVIVKSELQRRYEASLSKLADTAEAHWDMAERCRKAGLTAERDNHLEQVVRLAPDHEKARHALGYSRIDGRWIRQEDWMAKQGYVRHRGGWRLPQEIAIAEMAEIREARVVEWRKKIRIWKNWIKKGRENSNLAEREIRSVRDPHAAVVLAELLDGERESAGMKLLYIEALGEIKESASANALIKHALYSADSRIREACLDQLELMKPPQAVTAFIDALGHEKNGMVHRAAIALARTKDRRATIPLIDALITEHKQLRGGGGLQPMFSNQGGGLNVGGKPKIVKIKLKNDPVLHALSILHSGVNYGFNQAAWKEWYVATQTSSVLNLRRSE